MPFLSPIINLTIGMNDLVKFAENLNWYLEKEIVEIKGDYKYPTGMLEDIKSILYIIIALRKVFKSGKKEKNG